ncbi:HD domain-containing protein [Nitrosopumilus adriaticus]|uniref:Metal dependent phosphohydrolase n=1 Tax=Nitrosopumilus adriaticus TaxID=1580092 RepID=A0A0D5C5Q3_9ARCH|nr:HD domain-containing protein [Nitrosopumilus adriaticus]AJW71700.1 Metal dependent phosphohydrolase [Nitrosopumilus adriaticus]
MELVKSAEFLAKKKHAVHLRKDGSTFSKHLEDVVNRLKGLGVIDEELLSAGWLHEIIEDTDVSFDDLYEQFGNRISVIVSSLTEDKTLPRKQREKAYRLQLKDASFDAKLIKLCDISANLSDLKNSDASKSKKLREIKQNRYHLSIIRKDLMSSDFPKITTLLETINHILRRYGQRVIN